MKTVKQIKEELAKFPDDAVCYAYEGEVVGIIIQVVGKTGKVIGRQGVIYCSETDQSELETELIQLK